jgi:hypothetical protein
MLLYRLSDCAATLGNAYDIRQSQTDFLEGLTVEDLAAIGCIVEVLGQGYFSTMKNALQLLEYKDSLIGLRPPQLPRELFIPKSVRYVIYSMFKIPVVPFYCVLLQGASCDILVL